MSTPQVLLVCLGLGLLAKHGDAQPVLTQTAISVAENVGSTYGSVGSVTTGSITLVSVISQTNDGQFTVGVNAPGNGLDFTLTSGFTLDYETASSLFVVVQMVDGSPSTSTGTVTIIVADVNEEYSNAILYACLPGTSYWAGTTLATQDASVSGVTAAYAIVSQTPNVGHLAVNASTGEIMVADGKFINGVVAPIYTVTIQLISSSPSVTTSTSVLTIVFGCISYSGAATVMFRIITLLLAMVFAVLPYVQ